MKKIYLLLILITSFNFTLAQEDYDYVDKIAQDACECISQKKLTKPDLTSEDLGGCLLLSAKDYKVQLAKDYDLNLDLLDTKSGEKLGQTIGSRMAFICPTLVASLGNISEENKVEEHRLVGKVKAINAETIIVLEVKTTEGKTEKIYWLDFVNSDFDLQNNYQELKDKSIEAIYVNEELFDARINEYRKLKVLKTLNLQ